MSDRHPRPGKIEYRGHRVPLRRVTDGFKTPVRPVPAGDSGAKASTQPSAPGKPPGGKGGGRES